MPKKTGGEAGGAAEAAGKAAPRKKGAGGKRARKAPDAAAPAASAAPAAALRVKQIRSGIGHAATYRRTLASLGLKHHQDEVVVPDHPAIRGMLRKVWYLVSVRPVEG